MSYCYSPTEKLSQGDIIRHVKVIVNIWNAETHQPEYDHRNIIVLSRNCEIDKPPESTTGSNSVAVAIVNQLAVVNSKSLQGDIRRNRVLNVYYLPKDENLIEDCFIDWRTYQQISKNFLHILRSEDGYYRCTIEREEFKKCLGGLGAFLKPDE